MPDRTKALRPRFSVIGEGMGSDGYYVSSRGTYTCIPLLAIDCLEITSDSPLVIQRAIRHLALPQERPDIRIPPIQNRMHPHKLRPIRIRQRPHAQSRSVGISPPCPYQKGTYVPALGTRLEFRQSAFHAAAVADKVEVVVCC